ncbi:hypothetical protein Lalb_Chr05g0214341 [Lupinus albus]|uniref:Uncharacterized protein n=1 Tax=Lupinus albus TaxID=3870 RepID=A0A6A4QIU4_LUPAL|nr:hypothetical protein Lalb_Chr05g0214341 [Lupinus albus]
MMANDNALCCATQLIDGDGEFNANGLDHFTRTVNLSSCALSYAVVSIMGPQSSGNYFLFIPLFYFNVVVIQLVHII